MALYRSKVRCADSLYFGGGTPSLLSPDQVARIIEAAAKGFCLTPDTEITLEVNPGTITRPLLRRLKKAGINRLSIGVQSFDASNLRFLGRIHTEDDARAAISDARREGFLNVGLDLIYGLPGQSLDSWRRDLVCALSREPEHISCYMLSYEENTPLWNARIRGEIQPLSDEAVAGLYIFLVEFLSSNGYVQYEISNFARSDPNRSVDLRSRHNRKYWNFTDYLGFGPSAHSMTGQDRWWNHSDLSRYLDDLASGRPPVSGAEHLSSAQRAIEAIYLELRQNQGFHLGQFCEYFGVTERSMFIREAAQLREQGWMWEDEGYIGLTTEGMLRLDAIAENLSTLV